MRHLVLATCLAAALTSNGVAAVEVPADLKQFFMANCFTCHGEAKQKSDRRFDKVLSEPLTDNGFELLKEALNAMNRGDMPPTKSNVRRPSNESIAVAIGQLTNLLISAADAKSEGTTVTRRLNRFEYLHSIRDLLGVDTAIFDPTGDFPDDAKAEGFDNNGEALILSDYQLRRYIETAEAYVNKASYFNRDKPVHQSFVFGPTDFGGRPRMVKSAVTWRLLVDDKYLDVAHGNAIERHPNYPKSYSKHGAPHDGYYTITVRADAIGRLDHPYNKTMLPMDHDQPLKMAVWIAPTPNLLGKTASEGRVLAKIFGLADNQPQDYRVRVWMDRGSTPFFSWINGFTPKGPIERIRKKYHADTVSFDSFKNSDLVGANGPRKAKARIEASDALLISDVYVGPRLRLYSMRIDGPTYDQWPPLSHQTIYGTETDPSNIDISTVITRFATRAFRTPVGSADVDHYIRFVNGKIESGTDRATAIQSGIAAILASPRFLYLDEGNEDAAAELNPYQLATRLSYFLWSSVPDSELLRTVSEGKLMEPDVLQSQVERMLTDPRSDAFVRHFTDTWLRLHQLGSMPPDARTFKTYYTSRLESAMRAESHAFFRHVLEENRPITDFLDSDYTFVNDALSKHYGLPLVKGEHLRKVRLPANSRRGGLLGHASVLTVTANGIETSPVVRGVWILENILGTPPSPPPPDVEPIEPDTRGTTTIREQLNQHRHVAACAGCHQKIDPLGFALEFFDPIGGFRTRYPGTTSKRLPVDGSGQLPSGERFDDERGLKTIFLARKDQFAEALTDKLLTYATGRSMTLRDHADVEKVAAACAENGYGLRDLVIAVVRSDTFHKR